MKLGKLPARPGAVTFKLALYGSALKDPPANGGHYKMINDWQGMMGNDELGDCVCAEAGHGTLYFNYLAGLHLAIPTAHVIDMYSAVTGYKPGQPDTDRGTDMSLAASYRRKTGLQDANGKYHKIAAYLALDIGNNKDELKKAIYYFGGAGLGFNFPNTAMDQFNTNEPWTVVKGAKIDGGHDVWACGYDDKYIYVVTWGKIQKMSWAFFTKYSDEALAYLSEEMLKDGKSLEGFSTSQLAADLKQLN